MASLVEVLDSPGKSNELLVGKRIRNRNRASNNTRQHGQHNRVALEKPEIRFERGQVSR
jgi:hypothetical protein